MKITTTPATLASLEIVVMDDINPATMQPATAYGTTDVASIDGKPFYRIFVYVKDNGHHDGNVSIKILHKPTKPIPELTKVHLTGSIVITPWVREGRQALSILADGVEPLA